MSLEQKYITTLKKITLYEIAMNTRQFVGICLIFFLLLESFLSIMAFILWPLDFQLSKLIIIGFLLPLIRVFIAIEITDSGYFFWRFWDKNIPFLPGTYHEAFEKRNGPIKQAHYIHSLSGHLAHQTAWALAANFILSLLIILSLTSLLYLNPQHPTNLLKDLFYITLLSSSISFSSIIYSLQFFWKNIALTWAINLFLLICPISIIFYYIYLLIS